MSMLDGVSQCWPLARDCRVWWEAWAALAAVSAALGTWVVGFLAGLIAWMTYWHNRNEAAAAAEVERRHEVARHELWLADLRNACYVAPIVLAYEEAAFKGAVDLKNYQAITDFYRVCRDAVPKTSLRAPGYLYSEQQAHELFHLVLAQERVKSCADAAIATLAKDQVTKGEVEKDFAAIKGWAEALAHNARKFLPIARAMKPRSAGE